MKGSTLEKTGRATLPPHTLIRVSSEHPPVLLIVIDTEEDQWATDFSRDATAVSAMREIDRVQRIFDEFKIRPTYVVDYPVVSQKDGAAPLKEIYESGRAEIGAHLHPWVNPPFEEVVGHHNSYPGNLPPELEAAKLAALTDVIEANIGVRPAIYKAGRYGLGPHTALILEEAGFEVDLSACPPFDFGHDGGPDYSCYTADPYWFGERRALLGVPNTGAYVGYIQAKATSLYRLALKPSLQWAHLPGILCRIGAVDRLFLSPEGYSPKDLQKLTRALLRRGLRVFSLSFHSPSVKPGCTPYVQTEKDLRALLDSIRGYLEGFFGELNGVSMTPLELKGQLLKISPPQAP